MVIYIENKMHASINPISISVIIPAYNLEAYIRKTIDSVLNQTLPPFEILIIDDGSTDGTAEVIRSYGDKVVYIYQENKKPSATRNTGILRAKGNWLAFLDGDDQWLPTYLEKQTALLLRNPELKWSTCNYFSYLYSEDRKAPHILPEKAKQILAGKDVINNYLIASNQRMHGFSGSKIIHRSVFEKVGMFDEDVPFAEDLDMWWRINYHFQDIGYCPEPLAIYFLDRPDSLSQEFNTKKYIENKTILIDKHLLLAKKYNMLSLFEKEISNTSISYIRSLLFQNKPTFIKLYIDKYGKLMPVKFVLFIKLIMIAPSFTAWCCHALSKISRKLKLRKRVIRKPNAKPQK